MPRRPPAPCRRALASLVAALLAGVGCRPAAGGASPARDVPPTYGVEAVRFGTLPGFPVRALVAGADTGRRLDLAVMVWLLRGREGAARGRTVLVDAGFHRATFLERWKPVDYVRPSEAVAVAGVAPDAVTDIVVTHVHWDHVDGLDLFPRARVWIQRAEYEHHVAPDGTPRDRAVAPEDAAMLARLHAAGRLVLVDGDAREVLPGITVYTGGRHTWASQWVGVRTRGGTIAVASDNAYLYENLSGRRPIAQTLDTTANLAAQARMLALAGGVARVVPGHDPAVFTRHPVVRGRVARIE